MVPFFSVYCRVGYECIIMPNETRVRVKKIYCNNIESDSCTFGQFVELKLKHVDNEVCFFL